MVDKEEAGLLSEKQGQALIRLVRKTIMEELKLPITAQLEALSAACWHAPVFQENRGVFVTLHWAGRLRGCIGEIEGRRPLVDAVAENGRNAAVRDPRFPPVSSGELETIEIEVSALTPIEAVAGPSEIVMGGHGVVLVKGPRRAVVLPQVAPEQGWDLDTTLTHLALKAGLGPDQWRQDTEFLVFEAEVF